AADYGDVRDSYTSQQSLYYVGSPVEGKTHSFNVGNEVYNYQYQETVEGRKFAALKGSYVGVTAEYIYHPPEWISSQFLFVDEFRVQGRLAGGNVDYTGSGTFSGIHDGVFELRGLMAKNFKINDSSAAIPYLGLGYRYLNDGFEKYTPGGYNRESRYIYLPVGGDLRTHVGDGWGLSMNLEYDKLLSGEQTSHLEDVYSNVDPLVNTQREGFGVRGSVKVSKDINTRLSVFAEPFVRYWNIENSDIKPVTVNGSVVCSSSECLYGYEPSNVTTEAGIRLGVGF
ncbi:MAG: hypothetical protein HQL22_10485, partial [Candidatus Omnitrophica bacterium]|nr:hypothetical protein [Candidatus Omnitrophota bacterium]